jgi:methylglutaconyl-CoA hydratase
MPDSTASRPQTADGEVDVAIADAIATVRFSHPKGNSLPAALLGRLATEIRRLGTQSDVRVIVLRSGETGPFCAGASFDELKSIRDPASGKEFFMGFARVILAMTRCPKVIIARVHGKTVGGGVGLVAAADYAMAVDSAAIRLVGPVIQRKIGLGGFAALAIDADWRSARWAEEFGLYSRLFDSVNALDSGLDSFARKLARSNPQALSQLKSIFWQGTDDWDRLLESRAEMSGSLVLSDFTRAAIAAFDQGARS